MIIRIFGEGQYELSDPRDPRGLPAEARAGATAYVYLRRCVASADGGASRPDRQWSHKRLVRPVAVVADVILCSRIRPRSIKSSEKFDSLDPSPSRRDLAVRMTALVRIFEGGLYA